MCSEGVPVFVEAATLVRRYYGPERLRRRAPMTAFGETTGEGVLTNCISFTFTCSNAGPGAASHSLTASSRSPALDTSRPHRPAALAMPPIRVGRIYQLTQALAQAEPVVRPRCCPRKLRRPTRVDASRLATDRPILAACSRRRQCAPRCR